MRVLAYLCLYFEMQGLKAGLKPQLGLVQTVLPFLANSERKAFSHLKLTLILIL